MLKRKKLEGSVKNLYTKTFVSICLSTIDDETILLDEHVTDALNCADKKVNEFNDNIENGLEHSPELNRLFNQANEHLKTIVEWYYICFQ